MRVALFVEASQEPPAARGSSFLERIWNEQLCAALNLPPFAPIVPISKKHLVAMDPRKPRMSGSSEPLDMLLARKLRLGSEFDAAGAVPAAG